MKVESTKDRRKSLLPFPAPPPWKQGFPTANIKRKFLRYKLNLEVDIITTYMLKFL